jgi:hypothetical protein
VQQPNGRVVQCSGLKEAHVKQEGSEQHNQI